MRHLMMRATSSNTSRRGLSRSDVVISGVVLLTLVAIGIPFVLKTRNAARFNACQSNLRAIGIALSAYHDSYESLPPAGVWTTGNLRTVALHKSKRHDLFVQMNWAQMILPYAGEAELAKQFETTALVADDSNEIARTARVALMTCPSDEFNRENNPYIFEPLENRKIEYARGNYAINGGTNGGYFGDGSAAFPAVETGHLAMDMRSRVFHAWGTGVAGFNRSYTYDDFSNGLSTLVAVDELRSGIHSADPRGVWALGHIASSVTWGHGITGDAYGPNNQWSRADDIQGCESVHNAVGTQTLTDLEMPCVSYVDLNQQVASRSRHDSGVNVLFVDGHVRFIRNQIDPGLWHVMHSRETPTSALASDFDQWLELNNFEESQNRLQPTLEYESPDVVINSLKMKFVKIPAGEFTMGVSDIGNGGSPPPECPEHLVRITQPFLFGVCEVTQEQYVAVIGMNPSWHVTNNEGAIKALQTGSLSLDTSQFPVESVTWQEATDFCRKLSAVADEHIAGRNYRLPTEAEWEYACRAGTSNPYQWHAIRHPDDDSGEAAGIKPSLSVRKVGSFRPNEFGLNDMRGNVWEWCSDWFDRDYYGRSPIIDPQGPSHGFLKVVRGSDWIFVGEICRINYPIAPPWKSNRFIGFRVVCEIKEGAGTQN